ncbi:MAG: capsule assembly Wzi family protein [Woeseiaceae bacterium]|nr:capsule assembly Wzi family protein [Woeseiaceae bacterium]
MPLPVRFLARAVALALLTVTLQAGPYIDPGDLALRHDIQRLADAGIIRGPVTTWPLSWGPILADLRSVNITTLAPPIADAVVRVRERGNVEAQVEVLGFSAEVGFAEKPARIRGYQDTPRGNADIGIGIEWLGDVISAEINVQGVDDDRDDQDVRADGSMLGIVVGNWSVTANTLERWWGPGWDGSLILSNNARPIPSLTVDRVFTDSFRSKWLRWIGPWDFTMTFGQLESERVVPDARFFGMRINFRPLDTLEIGLSRTAQWCGDGRPCGADTLFDLFIGRDNRGDQGVGLDDEPGNQLAGVDFRWSPGLFERAFAVYGQFIGEDEAGGFPSRYIGQFGGEWAGYLADRWSARVFAEFSGTTCQFHESSERFNCAYNHFIYETGYRYRGRAIGHGADNDARLVSAGIVMVDAAGTQWRGLLRYGKLNRGGPPDPAHTLTPTAADLASVDVAYSRRLGFGTVDVGVGHETVDDVQSGTSRSDTRLYVSWRQLF